MSTKLLFTSAILILLTSCNSGPKAGPIELDNGEKWLINAEMMPPLRASEIIVSSFEASDLESYKSLAQELAENNKVLISSCTMKGKSHDELHKWLHPYMNMISDLGDTDNLENAGLIVNDIKKSFETFNQNFE
jgi:hypothetical protein